MLWRWRFILGEWLELLAFLSVALKTYDDEIVYFGVDLGSWVKTDMGQGFANAVGVESPPVKLDVCVKGLLEQVSIRCCR
jgi:hypothetical protein